MKLDPYYPAVLIAMTAIVVACNPKREPSLVSHVTTA